MKKKIMLSMLVILFVIVTSFGATMAWFTAEETVDDNVFTAGTVTIEAGEIITAGEDKMDNWNPGDCATKEFTITNTGTKSIVLRGIIKTQWYEWDGEEEKAAYDPENPDWVEWEPDHANEDYDNAVTVSLLENGDEWYEEPEGSGVWYYDGEIAGDEDAEVKLLLEVCLKGERADNQYQGKVFVLTAKFQAFQASHQDDWDWEDEFEDPISEE